MNTKNRVKSNQDFQTIIHQGSTLKNKVFVCHFLLTKNQHVRVGIAVSKKRGNAVRRNLIKRQIRAICMANIDFAKSYDLIVVARDSYDVNDYARMQEAFITLLTSFERNLHA
ncbi:MAG: ribonuclease P protein component [Bacilli bacterium]|nr:ribonuclease P protein component [Bacilli bacterium]